LKILTFDIEDWFHLLDHPGTASVDAWASFESRISENVDYILDQLDMRDQIATFFILGWVAEKYPLIVRRIAESGHQIGSHSYAHGLVYKQTKEEFTQDLIRSVGLIEDCIGRKVECYRAPGFSVTPSEVWVFEALVENGISYDSSIFPAARSHGGFDSFSFSEPVRVQYNRAVIKEFPLNFRSFLGKKFIFSGGGYFRILPAPLLKRLFQENGYLMTYFHPRDFDFGQPVLPGLSFSKRFKSYVGLSSSKAKFELILDCTEFGSLADCDKKIDWSEAPCISFTPRDIVI